MRYNPKSAVELYTRAIEMLPDNHDRVALLVGRAHALRGAGRSPEAIQDLDLAIRIADPDEAPLIRDQALITRMALGERRTLSLEWRALAEESRGSRYFSRIEAHRAMFSYIRGNLSEAAKRSREALLSIDDALDRRSIRVNLAWVLVLGGDWDEAEIMVGDVLEESERANDVWSWIPVLGTASMLAAWKGELQKAIDLGAQGVAITKHQMSDPGDRVTSLIAYATALMENGNAAATIDLLSEAPQIIESLYELNEVQPAFFLLAEAYSAIGDHDTAQAMARRGRPLLKRNLAWRPFADRVEAGLCFSRKDYAGALEIASSYLVEQSQVPYEQARIHEVAARTLRALRRRSEAIEQAALATAIYARLGANERLRGMSALNSSLETRSGRPRSTLPHHLTDREFEISMMLSQGMSTKEIASALFLSGATVKKHIENAMAKLGTNRRTALAAFARSLPESD